MSEAWIKVRTVLPTDGRLRIASRKCHASTVTCFGALVTLWCLADSHADEDGVLTGYTAEDVDALIGLPGFCSSLPVDWIDLGADYVKLPNYQQHNGSTGKSRSQAAKRQKVSRSKRDMSVTQSVTREDKKREEKKEATEGPVGPVFAGVDPKVVADFEALRKVKKAPITQTALDGIAREAAKASLTLESALRICCERGWTGFKAEWVTKDQSANASRPGGGRKEL